jgi:hypothetical protein
MNDVQLASQQQQPTVSLCVELTTEQHNDLLLFLDANPNLSQDGAIVQGLRVLRAIERGKAIG